MVSTRKFSLPVVLLFVSTFLVSSSSAETKEEVWATARPEFRERNNWCGTGTVYASIHEIQPITFGGIRLRGGTLFRLHGPHFELRSMFHKTLNNLADFESSFPDENGQTIKLLPLSVESFYESALRNFETESVRETSEPEPATENGDMETSMQEVEVGPGSREGRELNTKSDVDQNGVWLPKQNDEEAEREFLGFQRRMGFEPSSDSGRNILVQEFPEWEHNFATEVVDPRNTLEEQMIDEQFREELKLLQGGNSVNNVYEGGMEVKDLKYYWTPPSEETLTDILRYVLMGLIFVAAFVLVALLTSRRDVSDDETTVLVLNAPDHSTPLLQTYVVSDNSGDNVETGQMEHGVVLYQPPEVGTEEKK